MTESDHQILQAAELPILQRRAAAAGMGLTSTRFHQRLVAPLRTHGAERAYPATVQRWRRIMTQKKTNREGVAR